MLIFVSKIQSFIICSLRFYLTGGILFNYFSGLLFNYIIQIIFYTIIVLASLAIIVPSIALAVRRLHDINKSGWFYLVVLIPFVGSLIFLYFMIVEGDKTDNQYGPDPKAAERAQA